MENIFELASHGMKLLGFLMGLFLVVVSLAGLFNILTWAVLAHFMGI